MIAISLQSGSNGNCTYIESGGVRLLFDAGISGVRAERRLASHGREIRDVDALIISHDHTDHIASAGIFGRKYGIPMYVTRKTLAAAERKRDLGRLSDVSLFEAGGALRFGSICVETIPTPHDGVDGVAFVIVAEGKRLGVLTDLGHAFDGLAELIGDLDAVFLESNYDPDMLARGPYPPFLKQRIRGKAGHLSNSEAASLLERNGSRLNWACLAHLSEQNNTPEVALETSRRVLNNGLPLFVASRYEVGPPLEV